MEKKETMEKNVSTKVEAKTTRGPRKRKINNEVPKNKVEIRKEERKINNTEGRKTRTVEKKRENSFENKNKRESIKENIEKSVIENRGKKLPKFEFKKEN